MKKNTLKTLYIINMKLNNSKKLTKTVIHHWRGSCRVRVCSPPSDRCALSVRVRGVDARRRPARRQRRLVLQVARRDGGRLPCAEDAAERTTFLGRFSRKLRLPARLWRGESVGLGI